MSLQVRWAVLIAALAVGGGDAGLVARAQDAAPATVDKAHAAQGDKAERIAPTHMCRAGLTIGDIEKGARFPSYLEDNYAQLKIEAPALQGLKFEADAAADSEKTQTILRKTGETIEAMMPRVPNLIAKEELSQALINLPYMVSQTTSQAALAGGGGRRGGPAAGPTYQSSDHVAQGDELDKALDESMGQQKRMVFGYMIQSVKDPTFGPMLSEYRTNSANQPVEVTKAGNPGNPRGVGFSSSWMMFKPANIGEAKFRFLGRQKLGKHDTVVVAFAQIPGQVPLPAQVTMGATTCSYLTQGIAWIDEPTAQIVKLETDLLQPLTDYRMTKLYSSVTFGEVRIAEKNLTLWMPSDLEIRWLSRDVAGAERHKYSNYQLFGTTTKIVPQ